MFNEKKLCFLSLFFFFLIISHASYIDPCASAPCQNGGVCNDAGGGTFYCNCSNTPYGGNNCSRYLCGSETCDPGFKCVNLDGNDTVGCVCNFTTRDQCYFFSDFYENLGLGFYPDYKNGTTAPCDFVNVSCHAFVDFDTPIIYEVKWSDYGMLGWIPNDF